MLPNTPQNHHVEYMDVTQHWSPNSEAYAGGDGLITLLAQGWELAETVYTETVDYNGMRRAIVYHVEVRRGEQAMVMQVVHNPYVSRLIAHHGLNVRPISERA